MAINRNIINYHKSIAMELAASKDRIRNLIGNAHWLTDGAHKEAILRKILNSFLPKKVQVGTGFICHNRGASSQIDIIIYLSDKPTLFKDENLVLVTPDAAETIIEVKTKIRTPRELGTILEKIAKNAEIMRRKNSWHGQVGLFVFDDSSINDREILYSLNRHARGSEKRIINWIAFGPNRFFRYWNYEANSPLRKPEWKSYDLKDLAQPYFISNVVWDVTRNIPEEMQFAWFPIEGGKERYAKWKIRLTKRSRPEPI